MNERRGAPPEAAIVEKILGDARAEAARLMENARRGAEAERQKTAREIARVEAEARAGWEDRVGKARTRELSTARIESRRVLLRAREEAIEKLLGEIKQGLERLREDPARYRGALCNLAVEALRAVGVRGAVLRVAERDSGYVDDDFLKQVKSVLEPAGDVADFSVEPDGEDRGGGCVATSPDGRIVFDNTFERRLERLKPELRASMVEELEKNNE